MKADEIRARNRQLDEELLAEAKSFDPSRLLTAPAGEWRAAQLLAHLGEFPRFFAADLRRWRADPSAIVGRTMEHPVRLAAVEHPAAALAVLLDGIRSAFADLAGALEALADGDWEAKTDNAKYGPEPLSAFFDRYVLGHKAAHLAQLRSLGAPAEPG